MARSRKREYLAPIESVPHSPLERVLIANSPAYTMSADEAQAFAKFFEPPGPEFPTEYEPKECDENPNAYRDWLIHMLGFLSDCYPMPVNMALNCVKDSLIDVNRGLTPNLFKPAKKIKGGKSKSTMQKIMNLAVLAANYIHDSVDNDMAYEQELVDAGTSRMEIHSWRSKRIDPAYRHRAIIAWHDLCSARTALKCAIEDYRQLSPRGKKSKTSEPLPN